MWEVGIAPFLVAETITHNTHIHIEEYVCMHIRSNTGLRHIFSLLLVRLQWIQLATQISINIEWNGCGWRILTHPPWALTGVHCGACVFSICPVNGRPGCVVESSVSGYTWSLWGLWTPFEACRVVRVSAGVCVCAHLWVCVCVCVVSACLCVWCVWVRIHIYTLYGCVVSWKLNL